MLALKACAHAALSGWFGLVVAVPGAWAQARPPAAALPAPAAPAAADPVITAARQELIDASHVRYSGGVELELPAHGLRISADVIDHDLDRHHVTATGHVVFVTPTSRVAADRAEVDTVDRTGTFFNAFGSALVSDRVDRSFFGTQEPDAFFYGETIDKLGAARYRIRKGGFTTCIQPTPRWEMTAGSVTLTVHQRAVLTNAVLKVKDVPLFYLPALYYPIDKENRSTGFLLPIYGTSLVRGRTLSNAFFWAIDRSQDVTLMHDWFSKTGQGYGGEYRYVASSSSNGQLRIYRLDEGATTYRQNGADVPQPATSSLDLRGTVVQGLPGGFRARGSVDFPTEMAARQRYQQDLNAATSRVRSYQGNVSGAVGRGNAISATYGVSEVFRGADDSVTAGSEPRVQFTRALTRLGRLPLYVAATSEYAGIARFDTVEGARRNDQSLTRAEATPSLQFPWTKWPFLSVRSSIAWHHTWWTESLVDGVQSDAPLYRQYADLRATLTGPTVTRVWDTPGLGFAERLKHVIEPEVVVQRTTGFDDRDRVVLLETGDYVYGGVTSVTYGLTNRILARRRTPAPTTPPTAAPAVTAPGTRELLTVQLQQTHYSDPRASTADPRYGSAFTGGPGSAFSPIALAVRANPTATAGVTLRAEYDGAHGQLKTLQLAGTLAAGAWLSTSGGWSRSLYAPSVLDPLATEARNYLSSRSSVTLGQRHLGGAYQFYLNLSDGTLVEQRLGVFYNAQCCGVAFEYQTFDFGANPQAVVKQDRRFNISFTLAGLGSFSNALGAFGVGQGATGTGVR